MRKFFKDLWDALVEARTAEAKARMKSGSGWGI
jgi:hypothetical protein